MNFTKEQRQNYFTLVGEIGTIDVQDGVTQNGVPYIRGIITVKAHESDFEVNFFEMKKWKVGKPDERPNPRYEEVQALSNGQAVNFSCALEENKFAGQDGKIISNEQLTLNFINKPNQNQEPGLTFDMVGVVVKPLTEVVDEKGDLTRYSIKLGQGQYRADRGFSIVELSVDPNQSAAVNYVRDNYKLNSTVRVSGRGKSVIETREETVETLFGEPEIKTYQNHITNYFIEGGLVASEAMKYSDAEIEALTKSTGTFEEELKNKQASKPKAQGTTGFAEQSDKKDLTNLLGI